MVQQWNFHGALLLLAYNFPFDPTAVTSKADIYVSSRKKNLSINNCGEMKDKYGSSVVTFVTEHATRELSTRHQWTCAEAWQQRQKGRRIFRILYNRQPFYILWVTTALPKASFFCENAFPLCFCFSAEREEKWKKKLNKHTEQKLFPNNIQCLDCGIASVQN